MQSSAPIEIETIHANSSIAPPPENTAPIDANNAHYEGPGFFIPSSIDDIYDPESAPDHQNEDISLSIWSVFRKNTILDLSIDNPRIKAQRDWYARHQSYLNRVMVRAEPYLFHILEQSMNRGLPSELLLLPIVESAYDPFAYSHGRAAGIWQFIPGTGKAFGLKQTWWYEGRRDIYAATDAAMNYLESLNKQFDGDWMLALAAYNSGAGTVRNAVRKNLKKGRPTDFWSLELPQETRDYVPKLIAISQLFNTPEAYGISINDYSFEPYFAAIDTGGQIDLSLAANMAGISIEELYRLNPGFNRWATDPDGPHRLLIPIVQAGQMKLEIANLPAEKRVAWKRYTIKSGDSLLSISKKNNITTDLLKQINHLKSNTIVAGKTLLIPQSQQPFDAYSLSQDQRLISTQNRTKKGKQKVSYQVKPGDTFWSISKEYKVNHRSLAKWNSMAPTDTLSVGKTLVIWLEGNSTAYTPTSLSKQRLRKITYSARNGDSYAGIASRFNITLAQLKSWNKIDIKKYLQPGDRLTLYVDIANAP